MINYKPIPVIDFGFFKIYTWGLVVAIAFIVMLFLTLRAAKKQKGFDEKHIINILFFMILGGVIGSRLLHVITDLGYYLADPLAVFKLWEGGMVFYGGFIVALVFCWVYVKRNKLDFWGYGDLFAPYMALGIFIGRLACFLAGDDFGIATDLPWGMVFPLAPDSLPRHPTQIYMSLYGLALFFIVKFSRKLFVGSSLLLFFAVYSVFRFFVEFVRYYPEQFYIGFLTVSQWISIVIFLVCAVLFWKKWKLKK